MDTLPILVPVVAGIVLCPAVIVCMCLRQLQRRVDALEEGGRAVPAPAAAAAAPTPTGFIGGVTYGAASAIAPPLPTAPLATGGYPYFTQMPPPPPPQLQPLPYALQGQRRVV